MAIKYAIYLRYNNSLISVILVKYALQASYTRRFEEVSEREEKEREDCFIRSGLSVSLSLLLAVAINECCGGVGGRGELGSIRSTSSTRTYVVTCVSAYLKEKRERGRVELNWRGVTAFISFLLLLLLLLVCEPWLCVP